MGLFDNIFKKSKRPIACVYAGPEYFERKRQKESGMKRVYAGPEMMQKNRAGEDSEDRKQKKEDIDSIIEGVYNGPEEPDENCAGLEDVYNGPEEEPEDTGKADSDAEYPGNYAIDDDRSKAQVKDDRMLRAVYAGPEQMNNLQMFLTAYAGPQMNQNQMMMMVYAGPNYNPANTVQGFLFNSMEAQMKNASDPAAPVPQEDTESGEWLCACGTRNNGKFCSECGAPRASAVQQTWCCTCGTRNTGKFCINCGRAREKQFPDGTYLV